MLNRTNDVFYIKTKHNTLITNTIIFKKNTQKSFYSVKTTPF